MAVLPLMLTDIIVRPHILLSVHVTLHCHHIITYFLYSPKDHIFRQTDKKAKTEESPFRAYGVPPFSP